ncbi:exonuclease SbcCD subunit D [Brachybacterium sp. FME24]|uniref:exonuclease SbcCD subunit D n=1 Tax=Brachybacterium sp. FME24 TaxID=2742605 RepID=UPI0018660EA8|nr:exonuclease SbcCD subunit D [Brachybacterium sp. FME24]
MRILHTSDWHLGRTFHEANLHPHQEEFHDWLVELVTQRAIDVVVIPGDVYDRAVPPLEAVKLLGRTLTRLSAKTTVVLTPGNHDSADRLGFGAELMRDGVHILTDTQAALEHPVVVPDAHGDVLFFGLPYLVPDIARFALVSDESEPLARSHEAVTRAAMDKVTTRIAQYAEAAGPDAPRPRSVVLSHTFVTGGDPSDSERDLSVGGVDSVPASVMGGVDYVALGHLHGCQDLSARAGTTAWYSGSPLAFSFSEKNQRKSVLLVDLGAPGEVEVERIATPVPRRLAELRGSLDDVLAKAAAHREDWVKAVITDPHRPPHLLDRLRAAFPYLRHTEHRPEGREDSDLTPVVRREQDPMDVMGEFLEYVTGVEATDAERGVFARAHSAAHSRREEAS